MDAGQLDHVIIKMLFQHVSPNERNVIILGWGIKRCFCLSATKKYYKKEVLTIFFLINISCQAALFSVSLEKLNTKEP